MEPILFSGTGSLSHQKSIIKVNLKQKKKDRLIQKTAGWNSYQDTFQVGFSLVQPSNIEWYQ